MTRSGSDSGRYTSITSWHDSRVDVKRNKPIIQRNFLIKI